MMINNEDLCDHTITLQTLYQHLAQFFKAHELLVLVYKVPQRAQTQSHIPYKDHITMIGLIATKIYFIHNPP